MKKNNQAFHYNGLQYIDIIVQWRNHAPFYREIQFWYNVHLQISSEMFLKNIYLLTNRNSFIRVHSEFSFLKKYIVCKTEVIFHENSRFVVARKQNIFKKCFRRFLGSIPKLINRSISAYNKTILMFLIFVSNMITYHQHKG